MHDDPVQNRIPGAILRDHNSGLDCISIKRKATESKEKQPKCISAHLLNCKWDLFLYKAHVIYIYGNAVHDFKI